MEPGKCRSCGADVIWVRTVLGALNPLDALPVPSGNILLKDGVAHVLTKADLFEPAVDGERYISHFATCPEAAQHRKRKGK